MKVFVLTPERELYNGPAAAVFVPGVEGKFEIRSGHAPIVANLTEGHVRIKSSKGEEQSFPIANGFVEVLNDEVSVLVREPAVLEA